MPDVIILGAGAAGLMCAIEAGKRGRTVLVLERNAAIGKKIRISGGGRCNFTNLHTTAENFLSENPNFHKSALARFMPEDFIRMVEQHGIPYHEKKLGQLFCDRSSDDIIRMLQAECFVAGVEFRLDCHVSEVRKDKRFRVTTRTEVLECDALVVATGGLSIPRIGATGLGYAVAEQFGLRVIPPRPALVPLVLDGPEGLALCELHGLSFDALVRCAEASFRENVLITHRGLSGPAILQASSYWSPGRPLVIDTAPDADSLERLPRRFLRVWHALYAPQKPREQWSRKEAEAFERRTHHWEIFPAGTEGYDRAEVTAGGVDTRELSSATMESRKVPGLYFIGEVVDVTGQLGGFNFQWAWASGFACGQAV